MVELDESRPFSFFDRTQEFWVSRKVEKADTFWTRLRGLLGRRGLPPGHGMWLVPGAMIHTWFMAFAIDAVFLDPGLRVVRVITLPPWRLSPWVRGAASVLELPRGAAKDVRPGDELEIRDSDDV